MSTEAMGNPFLFLFHLRFQACVIAKKRREERNRLCELFRETLARRGDALSASRLFGDSG